MLAALATSEDRNRGSRLRHRSPRFPLWSPACAFLLTALAAAPVSAQAPAADEPAAAERSFGLFITVQNPIDSKVVKRVTTTARRFLDRADHRGVKIVFDFNPEGRPSCTTDFGPCWDLAKFLLSVQDARTVAFVHDEVSGHTVLPVLACREIVMSSKATLGDVTRDQPGPLGPTERQAYQDVTRGRDRFPAVVTKMIDKDVEVLEGTLGPAVSYIDRRDRERAEKNGFVVTRPEPVLAAGTNKFSVGLAQKFGLCGLVKENRQEVAEAYQLPPVSLREDPLQGRTPAAYRVVLKGTINAALRETIERRVGRAVHGGANFIIVQLECGAGDVNVARDLADYLRVLRDDRNDHPVMTVAYVTRDARDTATFLALGCTEIVMDSKAQLGDFERYVHEHPNYQQGMYRSLEELAREQGYSPVLVRGMLYPETTIHRVRSRKGAFIEHRLMDASELEADAKNPEPKWVDEGLIKPAGPWLALPAGLAKNLGVAELVVGRASDDALGEDGSDDSPRGRLLKVYAHYGLDKDQVRDAGLDWLDRLAAFLRDPLVSVFLVMIGIAGLVLELKMPGLGLPGVISALCFVLYFWAQSRLQGHLTGLAVLLFLLGLVLIGLEIFVLPGFGVTGISGIALVIVSLALATLVKKPETTHEWVDFGAKLSTMGISLGVAVVGAFVLAYYLPHIPYAKRLVLTPPAEKETFVEEYDAAPYGVPASLLGAIGVAATTLRPAGKARFGEEFVDVIAEGSYVHPGARVQVIEIEGNRVVVKEV